MWDQYAAGHRGACLVFDFNEAVESIDVFTHDKMLKDGNIFLPSSVHYADRPLDATILWDEVLERDGMEEALDDMQFMTRPLADIFVQKNTDWESETEFRVVHTDWTPSRDSPLDTVRVPFGSALRAVILGERAIDEAAPWTVFTTLLDAELLACTWENGAPTLLA